MEVEEDARPANHIFNRRDIEKTVTQTIHSIAYILSEIETLRRKYDLRPLPPGAKSEAKESAKPLRAWKSFSSLFVATSGPSILQQRMQENQKQKSFLAIAKWATGDAKKFEDKIRALKSLIDGLESISNAAGVDIRPPTASSSSAPISEDYPPPYSARPRTRRRATEGAMPSQLTSLPEVSSSSDVSHDPNHTRHFNALKKYLADNPDASGRNVLRRPRDKLAQLSAVQLYELVVDVYDELNRRQTPSGPPLHLPETPTFHPKRNQARRKLGTLPEPRFHNLVSDVAVELERRYPVLPENFSRPRTASRPRAHSETSRPSHSRHLPITEEHPRPSTSGHKSVTNLPIPLKPSASSSTTKLPLPDNTQTVEIFKSFRVSIEDPTCKVLPAALKKYDIHDNWEDYSLYITCGEKDRVLGLDEKPLILFKQLKENGQRPMFQLRKTNVNLMD